MSRTPPEQKLVSLQLPAGYEAWSLSAYDQARRKLHELHGLSIIPHRVEPMEAGGIEISYRMVGVRVLYRCLNDGDVETKTEPDPLKLFGEE